MQFTVLFALLASPLLVQAHSWLACEYRTN
jgi:hypothetical protein